MRRNDVHTCPACATAARIRGTESFLYVCFQCGTPVVNELNFPITQSAMPDDWSIIQLGTSGVYKDQSFEVIGKIRLQLRQEYKNYWCLWYDQGQKYGWLAESFGKYAVCEPVVFNLDEMGDIHSIKAGDKFDLYGKSTVVVDYVDPCEWISISGEIAHWKDVSKRFISVQAQNDEGIIAFFNLDSVGHRVNFIVGETTALSALSLKAIREWNEWK